MIQCFPPPQKKVPETGRFYGLRLVSISKMDSAYKEIHPRILHKHEYFLEILYVHSGNIIINNVNTLHDEDPLCNDNLNMYCLTITNVHIKGLPDNCLISSQDSPVFHADEYAPHIETMMSMIYSMLAASPNACAEICNHLAVALLTLLYMLIQRNSAHAEAGDKALRTTADIISTRCMHYIESHYDEPFTLEDISRELCVSSYYLSHVFKKSTGFSPMHYTIRRRIGEAQSLLILTDKTILEIALTVGFGSQCQFYNLFKKYIGMPPGEYRKTYRN